MTDFFALLDQPRRPWLEPETLKAAFHRGAALHHPDAGGDASAFALLNSAYSTLREPASRLRHLLELEGAPLPGGPARIPPALADFFMEMAGARRRLDSFLTRQQSASSPLSRALLAGEKKEIREVCTVLKSALDAAHALSLDQLRELDAAWPASLEALGPLLEELVYLTRWTAQAREAIVSLDL